MSDELACELEEQVGVRVVVHVREEHELPHDVVLEPGLLGAGLCYADEFLLLAVQVTDEDRLVDGLLMDARYVEIEVAIAGRDLAGGLHGDLRHVDGFRHEALRGRSA